MSQTSKDLVDIPKDVIDNLYSGENVNFCIKKKVAMELKPKYLIISDRRVIFYDQKIAGRYDLNDIPYSKLEHVYFNEGLLASEFTLKNEDKHHISINWLGKKECKDAIITIRDAINAISIEPVSIQKKKTLVGEKWSLRKPLETITRTMPMAQVIERTQPAQKTDDPVDKLKKIKELNEIGILSDGEYEEKRREIIAEI